MSGPILAEMSAADLAIGVVTGCAIVATVAVLFALQRVVVTLRRVSRMLDDVADQAIPLVEELGTAVSEANEQLERVDHLVGSAESISATVDATSKLAYRALSAPVIKTVAAGSGAARVAKRIRKE